MRQNTLYSKVNWVSYPHPPPTSCGYVLICCTFCTFLFKKSHSSFACVCMYSEMLTCLQIKVVQNYMLRVVSVPLLYEICLLVNFLRRCKGPEFHELSNVWTLLLWLFCSWRITWQDIKSLASHFLSGSFWKWCSIVFLLWWFWEDWCQSNSLAHVNYLIFLLGGLEEFIFSIVIALLECLVGKSSLVSGDPFLYVYSNLLFL